MSGYFLEPDFPEEVGEDAAVTFVKDGSEYRLMRYDVDTWLIHKQHVPRESFELIITPDGKSHIIVEGKGHAGYMHATGVTRGVLFTKLF